MAIQQVSVSKYENPLFFGDSVTVPRPADMQNGDFVVVWVGGHDSDASSREPRDWTLPAGFSVAQAQVPIEHQFAVVMAVKWIEDISSEPADYTFTMSDSSYSLTAIAIAYRGVDETTPFSCEPYTIRSTGSEIINFPDGQPLTDDDIYLAFYSRMRNEGVSWQPRLDENPDIEIAVTGCDTDSSTCTRTAAASFVTGTTDLITGQTATHNSRRYQSGSIVLHAAGTSGITITDIKEPNEADSLVDGVTNARVKVWFGSDDAGEEDELHLNQTITNGSLTTELDGEMIDADVVVTVDWDAGGGEHKFFRHQTTVIDLDAED